jgi:flagellar basal-body rod protein FlgG
MNRALYAAASGMAAAQQNLDVIAENLSNADVAGFKGAQASFGDIAAPGAGTLGTASLGLRTLFTQGKLEHSGGPFDLAIQGEGFFSVSDSRGRIAYTRNGEFTRSSDGTLRNVEGWTLHGVRIPEKALSVSVAEDGTVTALTSSGKTSCGRIRLTAFTSPESLRSAGGALFYATHEAGKPRLIQPGASESSAIKFGMLEQSNVTIIEAMMEILAAQRAYEANSKGVQAADEMLRIADNLNRG